MIKNKNFQTKDADSALQTSPESLYAENVWTIARPVSEELPSQATEL